MRKLPPILKNPDSRPTANLTAISNGASPHAFAGERDVRISRSTSAGNIVRLIMTISTPKKRARRLPLTNLPSCELPAAPVIRASENTIGQGYFTVLARAWPARLAGGLTVTETALAPIAHA